MDLLIESNEKPLSAKKQKDVDGKITGSKNLTPPAHEPGVIPHRLHEEGTNIGIVGGIGEGKFSKSPGVGAEGS